MCYAEFGDILQAIDDLDADVISLEAARSHMEVARELTGAGYPSEVGPGVYDIHSPRVPRRRRSRASCGTRSPPSRPTGCGSTRTAA